MENTDFSYDNPYKYNAKEFDMATGLYYYGARYYDPKRSFWLSVDPLAEITMSPYAYVWNDPVNFADPTGMMGERVGGNDPCDPPAKRSFVRKTWDWLSGLFGGKSQNRIIAGMPTGSVEPDQNTLPWYLNKDKYGGSKPILTLGAHNIVMPYIERSEYGADVLENGDVFLKNTVGSIYNGIAFTWNDGMQGKEGSAMLFEGDRDMESTVRHIVRGKADVTEYEGLAAAIILHKVTRKSGGNNSSKILLNTPKQLQAKFKHAVDFGITGNYNKLNAAKFSSAINQHINSPDIQVINGTYRGDPVIHYVNPNTGLNVISSPSGQFKS